MKAKTVLTARTSASAFVFGLIVGVSAFALCSASIGPSWAADSSSRIAEIDGQLLSLKKETLKIHAMLKSRQCENEATLIELSYDRDAVRQVGAINAEFLQALVQTSKKLLADINNKVSVLEIEREKIQGAQAR